MLKLLSHDDMARISCPACAGCGDCCRGMGDTIHLDPYDVYSLCRGLHTDFSALLHHRLELHVRQGLILPYLKMDPEQCTFLDEKGRCSVHSFRPGLCRLFPLGRNYENGRFDYFVVENGCDMPGRSKIRISSFLDIPELERWESFISSWHYLIKDLQENTVPGLDAEKQSRLCSSLLQLFFILPYNDFYSEFKERLSWWKENMTDF